MNRVKNNIPPPFSILFFMFLLQGDFIQSKVGGPLTRNISFHLICLKPQLKHFHYGGHFRSLQRSSEGQTLDFLLLLYSLGFQLSFDMHKPIVKTFSIWRSFQVIRGRQRSSEGQTDLLLLLYSLGFQLSFDMHKTIVKTFLFLEVIQVIRGRKRSLEG